MNNTVNLRVPNFVDPETGVFYSDIEVVVQSDDGDIHDAVRVVKTLENPRSADNE